MEPITFFGTTATIKIWQYDYGVQIQFPAVEHIIAGMPCQWHYAGVTGVDSRTITDDNGTLYVAVPDAALQQTGAVVGYIYVHDATSGRTRYVINVQILERASTDDTPSADEVTYIGQKVVEAAASASAAAASELAAKASEDAAAEAAAQIVTDEDARKTAETARADAETLRGGLYNAVKSDYDSGAFKGERGDRGDKGDKGDAGGTWTALDQIPLVDAGNYFNGANPEAALQEVGAQLVKMQKQTLVNLIDNGANYANWAVTGTGTTKGAGGIHLVNATNTETAKLNIASLDVAKLYTLTVYVKAVSTTGSLIISSNLTGTNITVANTIGLQTFAIATKVSSLTDKHLWFFIYGGADGDYVDFEVVSLYEAENYAVTTTPKLIMTFDDGYSSVYTKAFAYMKTKGLKGTAYIISNSVGATNYMTDAQLEEMYAAGWCIANHAIDATQLGSADLATALTKIGGCQTWLEDNSYLTGLKHFAYPGGQYNNTVIQALKQLGIKTARTTVEALNGPTIANLYKLTDNPCGGSFYTLSQVKGQITTAISQNKTIILLFHRLVDTAGEVGTDGMNFLYSDFQALCDWIITQSISVMTVDEWYNSLETRNPS